MKISNDCIIKLEYTLKDSQGTVLDSSEKMGPLEYIQGHEMLISGLEKELEGKEVGAEFTAVIPPEGAYGEVSEELYIEVPRDQFPPDAEIEVGMQFDAGNGQESRLVTVEKIEGDTISINANHPLAGETLHFDVKILDVRQASEEEIANLMYGGAGGCSGCDPEMMSSCGGGCGHH